MRLRNRLVIGAVAGMILSLAAALSVLAYYGQVVATVTVSGPAGNVSCGTTSTVTAFVQDTNGNPVTDRAVNWTFTGGNIAGDKFSAASSTTDSTGHASVHVTFACPGSSTIASNRVVHVQAMSDEILGSVAVTVTTKGLPSTSTDPLSGTSTAAVLAAAFAVLLGGWIILRRVSAARG